MSMRRTSLTMESDCQTLWRFQFSLRS
ncbi:MAG: hypothetical protein FD149_2727, partial [Rhodospirillaceae bacterium]